MDQGIVNPTPFQNRGFTLVELLLVVAITSIITAVGLPVYRGYVETAYMSKVNAAYENAIRLTRQEFSKNTTKISLGLASTMPVNDASWIDKFDKGGWLQRQVVDQHICDIQR